MIAYTILKNILSPVTKKSDELEELFCSQCMYRSLWINKCSNVQECFHPWLPETKYIPTIMIITSIQSLNLWRINDQVVCDAIIKFITWLFSTLCVVKLLFIYNLTLFLCLFYVESIVFIVTYLFSKEKKKVQI